jgi:hypothetical protein
MLSLNSYVSQIVASIPTREEITQETQAYGPLILGWVFGKLGEGVK